MRALLAAGGLPPDYVQALDARAAADRAGVPLASPAWWFAQGGWISPAHAVRALLDGSRFSGGAQVDRLERHGDLWRLIDATGRVLGESATVVLANAASAAPLLQPLGHAAWPTAFGRGQVSVHRGGVPTPLALPVTGDGYALPLPDGGLLCGATRTPDDAGLDLRPADHAWNIERARRLTGLDLPPDPALWQGRAGLRLQASDRLPIAGAPARPPSRATQARWLAREPGLFVITALGSRGLTLAPLLGRLVAAMACAAPWPLEQDLADAIDPARWLVRAARGRGSLPAGAG
jgi:tRNA 5-methylaminomethyl-2-thiouridine biosynthesis bifunctional protein